jgi:hypothetical protein
MIDFVVGICIASLYFISGCSASASFHQSKEDNQVGGLHASISFCVFLVASFLLWLKT